MEKNTPININQELRFKLEVGDKLNLFCTHNIYKTKIITEDNTEILMPSKNYFFVGNRLYIPYNNYITDEFLQIPYEYRYIKVHKNKYAADNSPIEERYKLSICDKYGTEYHFNYNQFYVPLENIVEKSKVINLQELYNTQEENGNLPLFKIVPEEQSYSNTISCAKILDLCNQTKLGKLSSESIQYKHNIHNGNFTLSYSDSSKYKVNNNGSITTHNIREDIIKEEMENNPIFLLVKNGKFFFTDTKQQDKDIVEDYKTGIKVLHDHFRIDAKPDDNINIDMDKQFVFKIIKSNLLTQNNKNFASIILEGKEIPLIPTDKNSELFFDHDFHFQYCNNVREVFRDDAPLSGFIKDFYSIAQEKLDSNNIYLTVKADEKYQIKTYFSDDKENVILDLPKTTLIPHFSNILPLEYSQSKEHTINTKETTHIKYTKELEDDIQQDSKPSAQDKNSSMLEQDSRKYGTYNYISTQEKDNTPQLSTDTISFPLPRKNVNIGENIDDDKHHISFTKMTYKEMLDFYDMIQKNYSYEYVNNAYENIIKYYGREEEINNAYIDKHNHVFINGYDFGLLQ